MRMRLKSKHVENDDRYLDKGAVSYIYQCGCFEVEFTQGSNGSIGFVRITPNKKWHCKWHVWLNVDTILVKNAANKGIKWPFEVKTSIYSKEITDADECKNLSIALKEASKAMRTINRFFEDCKQRDYLVGLIKQGGVNNG